MIVTDAAQEMIDKLEALSDACDYNDPADIQPLLLPIRQLSQRDLARTRFCESPVHAQTYQLPLLKPDGTPLGGFGKAYAFVEVYQDGTAIARLRCWKYDYRYDHEHKGCLDGKPSKAPNSRNDMTVRFYLLGCKHEYEEQSHRASEFGLTLFRTDHLHICKNCGHRFVVDSSD